jgi:hypothetical protein
VFSKFRSFLKTGSTDLPNDRWAISFAPTSSPSTAFGNLKETVKRRGGKGSLRSLTGWERRETQKIVS